MENLGKNTKFLLMDDEPIALHVHKKYLEKMNCTVEVAVNGKQAIALYEKNNGFYAAIILDGGLPDIDGFEIAKYIRKYEKENNLKRMPLIMLSGYPRDQIERDCALVDIDVFAIKPIKFQELQNILIDLKV